MLKYTIQGKKIYPMESPEMSEFDTLIPLGGIEVYPGVIYQDVNHISGATRVETKKFFSEDDSYSQFRYHHDEMYWIGGEIGKRYCAYIYREEELIGNMVLEEYINQPDGYGEKDFLMTKFVFPKFRGTKYSRYMVCDLTHIMFCSDKANYLYAYSAARRKSGSLFNRIDKTAACKGPQFEVDKETSYLKYKKLVKTLWKDFILMEWNGYIYRELDYFEHMMTPPGGLLRSEEEVREWVYRMSQAAKKVRERK